MDAGYEDKMYRQIEKSLSNNINERLYVPIEVMDRPVFSGRSNKPAVDSISYDEGAAGTENDYFNRNRADDRGPAGNPLADNREEGSRLTRAEYIMQAREACLRQLNAMDSSSRTYDSYGASDTAFSTHGSRKKAGWRGFLMRRRKKYHRRR